jgi:DNA-binding transcriptional MerR regulator
VFLGAGVSVEQVEQFLKHANECLSMAGKTADEERKQKLVELASQWITLAGDRQKLLELKAKQ